MVVAKQVAKGKWLHVVVALALIAAGWSMYDDYAHTNECSEYGVVKTVTAVNNRMVTLVLEDGSQHVANQPTIKTGDKYCTKYTRR